MGSMGSGKNRPVYVNGTYCKSMKAGAAEAGKILGAQVMPWQMQRLVSGDLKIEGVVISEKRPPVTRDPPARAKRSAGVPLLRYPHGERPLDRGIIGAWR